MARPVVPLMEYIVYEDYIAEFLCINKDNLELECHGKCYLMQKLTEQNDQKRQNLPKIVMEEYPIGFVDLQEFVTKEAGAPENKRNYDYLNPYTYLFTAGSFHPPNAIS
ncbi:hypothetical protein EW142_14600 [Flagellimonas allohymeniacidonis]|uniref:Uncharacterized protein n=2 Tax=Flagellimonas allohymeniacidonis TaxID=2517819 RepID=A0A4Q8QEK7_9FLAO|nr:hypothetical protein EW142_14600 [Allomuricauda hymeniacidonis]